MSKSSTGAVLAVIWVLLAGCGGLFSGDTGDFDDVLAKVPLPPDTNEFVIDGEDSTDFYLRTTYTDRNEADIADFYRTYFKENGWTSTFLPEEELDGLMDYQKGKAGINVTTIAIASEIHLMVIYREDELSREEFDTKAGASESPEVKALVQSVRDAYENAASYSDTGTLELIDDGEVLGRATFKTAYKDPGDLLFEHWDSTGDFHFTADILSKKGDLVQFMSDTDTEPTVEEDISMAIGTLYGVTLGTSGNVPELLLKLDDGVLFHLIDLKMLMETKTEDGTLCHRLHGKDALGQENTIWIGKKDLLIRKIESVEKQLGRKLRT